LNVTDYEATVQWSSSGKWKYRWKLGVHVYPAIGRYSDYTASGFHDITHFESLDAEAANRSVYRSYTVGELFDDVDDLLSCQENSCNGHRFTPPPHYVVEFDQAMGYPRSITSISEYATVETRVEYLTILKQSDIP
jgi:hypothetical protein